MEYHAIRNGRYGGFFGPQQTGHEFGFAATGGTGNDSREGMFESRIAHRLGYGFFPFDDAYLYRLASLSVNHLSNLEAPITYQYFFLPVFGLSPLDDLFDFDEQLRLVNLLQFGLRETALDLFAF